MSPVPVNLQSVDTTSASRLATVSEFLAADIQPSDVLNCASLTGVFRHGSLLSASTISVSIRVCLFLVRTVYVVYKTITREGTV